MTILQKKFIEKIGAMAQDDMKRTSILASLTIAQAILESAWGKSGLTRRSNNLFGIKGKGVSSPTFEYINGERVDCTAEFKKYPSWEASIADHSALFHRLPRYKNLIGCIDYKQACYNVQADGYATAPNYASILIRLIEQYNLTRFDNITAIKPSKPVEPNVPSKPTYRTYTVKRGDSFWRIAKQQMGSGARYMELAKFNGLKTTSVIHPGQTLKIPTK